ncbi:hypothetical protein ACFX1S_014593 [Malus domestica]
MPLRFSNKQSCRGSGSRDSENGASSIFEKAILLGVWLSRFGERCLFDFEKVIMLGVWLSRFEGRWLFDLGASNLVGSVFSNIMGAASFTCLNFVRDLWQNYLWYP